MVFPTFFNLSLNLAIKIAWSEPQSAPDLVFSDCIELLHFSAAYSQCGFIIDYLVMSLGRIFSCIVGRGCLLWPVRSLGKTLLAFALPHFVLQGQICLLLQVSLDFLLLHSSFLSWKGHFWAVLVLEGLVGHYRTFQLQLLQHYWLGLRVGLLSLSKTKETFEELETSCFELVIGMRYWRNLKTRSQWLKRKPGFPAVA